MRALASASSAVGVKIHGRMILAQSMYVAYAGTANPRSQNQSLTSAVVTSRNTATYTMSW